MSEKSMVSVRKYALKNSIINNTLYQYLMILLTKELFKFGEL